MNSIESSQRGITSATPDRRRHRARWWLTVFGLCTLAGLACAGAQYIALAEASRQSSSARPLPAVLSIIVWNLVAFYLWGALSPLIALFAHRFPVEGTHRWRNLSFHIPAAAFFILAEMGLWSTLRWMIFLPPLRNVQSLFELFWTILTSWLITDIMVYVMILVIIHALKYHREFVAEQSKSAEMRAHLVSAELQALKTQLHPHFLFNTLNAVSELVYDSPATADRILAQLSTLLRLSMKSSKAHEIPLREELDFLRKYVEIQQTLLEERLVVNFRIDSNTIDARVPNMFLQPLVENAIRHGIAPRARGGVVEIAAERRNGTLHVSVRDDGLGLAAVGRGKETKGIGLANTRARLEHLYGDAYRFELTETPGGGLTVGVAIPLRENGRVPEEEDDNQDSHADSGRHGVGATSGQSSS